MIGSRQDHITGMTMAFLTMSSCEVFQSLNLRSRTRSIFRLKNRNRFLTGAVILSLILAISVIYIPGVNTVFSLKALSAGRFLTGMGLAVAIIPVVELVKFVQSLFNRR
jgi:Ca2+-transporting ATPase